MISLRFLPTVSATACLKAFLVGVSGLDKEAAEAGLEAPVKWFQLFVQWKKKEQQYVNRALYFYKI